MLEQLKENTENAASNLLIERERVKSEYSNAIDELKGVIKSKEIDSEKNNQQIAELKSKLQNSEDEIEDLQGQLNSVKNKLKSLQAENDKLLPGKIPTANKTPSVKGSNLSSPSLSEPGSPHSTIQPKFFSLEEARDKEKIVYLENEIKALKDQNKQLSTSLET